MNVSRLSLNLLLEQVYMEGQVNLMYESLINEGSPKRVSTHLLKKIANDLSINSDFLMTYGVGIASFVGPVSELLNNKSIRLTKYDVTLLVITSFYILLNKSKSDIKLLLAEIDRRDIPYELDNIKSFIKKTLDLFIVVGKKIGVTITTLLDVLAFTFMSTPIMEIIKNIAHEKGFNINNVGQLIEGLILSSGTFLIKNLLNKNKLKESTEDYSWVDDYIEHKDPLEQVKEFIFNKLKDCDLLPSQKVSGWTKYIDKNGEILFADNIDTGNNLTVLYVNYKIWLKCEEMGCSYEDFQKICKDMLYEVHKRKVYTTIHSDLITRY